MNRPLAVKSLLAILRLTDKVPVSGLSFSSLDKNCLLCVLNLNSLHDSYLRWNLYVRLYFNQRLSTHVSRCLPRTIHCHNHRPALKYLLRSRVAGCCLAMIALTFITPSRVYFVHFCSWNAIIVCISCCLIFHLSDQSR